jgi:CRP-like cAMP-binding protein
LNLSGVELEEARLSITPYRVGISNADHVILRTDNSPSYLSVDKIELAVIEDLLVNPITVNTYLSRHLSGHLGLRFREAVALLMKLLENGFLANVSSDISLKLEEFSDKSTTQANRGFQLAVKTFGALLDLPLLTFEHSEIHPILRKVGAIISSPIALILYSLFFWGLAWRGGTLVLPDQEAYFSLFNQPEILLLQSFFAFSLASSWLALMQMTALAGLGAKYIGGSIRVTCLCVLRLSINDEDVFALNGKKMTRYHIFTLLSPWLMAVFCWQFVHGASILSLGGLFAGTFVMLGYLMFCPLYRSALVKVGEGFLAQLDVLGISKNYLSSGLLTGVTSKEKMDRKQIWITIFASTSMIWLYAMFLMFFDALIQAIPDLWVLAHDQGMLIRATSAVVVLLMLVLAMTAPLIRLLLIPIQNIFATLSVPLRKARVGIRSYRSKNIPVNDAVVEFIKGIPVLGHLDNEIFVKLVGVLRFKNYGVGQVIIQQGEIGSRFFILADGRAQVLIKNKGIERVVDELVPGDSFGEIALVEKTVRKASIRTITPSKVLYLDKKHFDQLFPEGSENRIGLTNLIRHVKLIMDSQALSHLSPRQIRELLATSEFKEFQVGEQLIKEGDIGDAAYLMASGRVKIESSKESAPIAELSRGELVGATALVNEIPRTASVTAVEAGKWLRIDKPTFLRMCMSNMFVAMLVSDLSQGQIDQGNKGGVDVSK